MNSRRIRRAGIKRNGYTLLIGMNLDLADPVEISQRFLNAFGMFKRTRTFDGKFEVSCRMGCGFGGIILLHADYSALRIVSDLQHLGYHILSPVICTFAGGKTLT